MKRALLVAIVFMIVLIVLVDASYVNGYFEFPEVIVKNPNKIESCLMKAYSRYDVVIIKVDAINKKIYKVIPVEEIINDKNDPLCIIDSYGHVYMGCKEINVDACITVHNLGIAAITLWNLFSIPFTILLIVFYYYEAKWKLKVGGKFIDFLEEEQGGWSVVFLLSLFLSVVFGLPLIILLAYMWWG